MSTTVQNASFRELKFLILLRLAGEEAEAITGSLIDKFDLE